MLDLTKYDGHSPGPWYDDVRGNISCSPGKNCCRKDDNGAIVKCDSGYYGPRGADRELIIDAPLILAELREARETIKKLTLGGCGKEGHTTCTSDEGTCYCLTCQLENKLEDLMMEMREEKDEDQCQDKK